MSSSQSTTIGSVARIEWERFHHATSAIILLADGQILHVHSQGLGALEQDYLVLTRDGDTIEVTVAEEPEPHVCRYINQSIAALKTAKAA